MPVSLPCAWVRFSSELPVVGFTVLRVLTCYMFHVYVYIHPKLSVSINGLTVNCDFI
jgi:hypothetical protein